MGIMDNMKQKAKDALDQHGEKIDQMMDKAKDFANDKTGGDHADKLDQGVQRAKDALERGRER